MNQILDQSDLTDRAARLVEDLFVEHLVDLGVADHGVLDPRAKDQQGVVATTISIAA